MKQTRIIQLFILFLPQLHAVVSDNDNQASERDAKIHFCSCRNFDSISYDGEAFRFTINHHKLPKKGQTTKYSVEQFKLFPQLNDSFRYSRAINDNRDNVLPLGGFFVDQLGTYFEFYKNLPYLSSIQSSSHSQSSSSFSVSSFFRSFLRSKNRNPPLERQILYRRFTKKTPAAAATIVSKFDNCSPSSYCNFGKFRYFPAEIWRHRFDGKAAKPNQILPPIAFAYDQKREKIFYIISSKTDAIVAHSLRSVSSGGGTNRTIHWFTKDIARYGAKYRFLGAIIWRQSGGKSSKSLPTMIVVFANRRKSSPTNDDNIVLLEMIDRKGKIDFEEMSISWQALFGCDQTSDQTRSTRSSGANISNSMTKIAEKNTKEDGNRPPILQSKLINKKMASSSSPSWNIWNTYLTIIGVLMLALFAIATIGTICFASSSNRKMSAVLSPIWNANLSKYFAFCNRRQH